MCIVVYVRISVRSIYTRSHQIIFTRGILWITDFILFYLLIYAILESFYIVYFLYVTCTYFTFFLSNLWTFDFYNLLFSIYFTILTSDLNNWSKFQIYMTPFDFPDGRLSMSISEDFCPVPICLFHHNSYMHFIFLLKTRNQP